MTRRRFTEREVIECLIRQGAVIPCKRCRAALKLEDVRSTEREHLHEIALDGPDTVENCGYSHGLCHSVQTNGTPSTTAGSSKNRIAKTRPTRADKFEVRKQPLDADTVGALPPKCRGCGEIREDCKCPAPAARQSAFARARR